MLILRCYIFFQVTHCCAIDIVSVPYRHCVTMSMLVTALPVLVLTTTVNQSAQVTGKYDIQYITHMLRWPRECHKKHVQRLMA